MSNFGRFLGEKIRSYVIFVAQEGFRVFKIFVHSATNKISQYGAKKALITMVIIAFTVFISYIIYSEVGAHFKRKQVIAYYKVQPLIRNSISMSLEEINYQLIKPFSGILKVNNAMKVAYILGKSDVRYKDAIHILQNSKSFANMHHLNELLSLSALAIQINHNTEERSKADVIRIAKSRGRFAIIAKELLTIDDLSNGKLEEFYRRIEVLSQSSDIKTEYMKNRINELSYIAYQNGYIQ